MSFKLDEHPYKNYYKIVFSYKLLWNVMQT